MPKKLSQFKVGKILKLYLQGYSQTAIAHKLNIDQSTVSFQVSKFKDRADYVGIAGAAEEIGIMNEVEMVHSLAVDLMNEKLTVEEAAAGMGVVSAFEKLGIEQDYHGVIKAAAMMYKEGFIDSAIELAELEQSTGLGHEELVDKAVKTSQQLEKALIQLEETNGKLDDAKNNLEDMEIKRKLAADDLATHMEQIGVDEDRLKKVEALAMTLKKAGVDNQQLEEYLQRQQQLNEAGIGIDVFTNIIDKVGVATAKDKGKLLLDMLTEYSSLSQANQALKLTVGALEKETAGLEEKAALKGKLQAEVDALKAEKASLEPYVSELHTQKNKLEKVMGEVASLSKKQMELENEIANLESYKTGVAEEIKSLKETTGNLEKRKTEYAAVKASLLEVEERLARENRRLQIFDSFLGFVKSSAIEKLEEFAADATYFVEAAKNGKHSPQLVKNMIIQELTGGTLQVLRCTQCEVKFVVDKKPEVTKNGYCPLCGSDYDVKVDKDALEILKTELFNLKNPQFKVTVISPGLESPKQKNDDSK